MLTTAISGCADDCCMESLVLSLQLPLRSSLAMQTYASRPLAQEDSLRQDCSIRVREEGDGPQASSPPPQGDNEHGANMMRRGQPGGTPASSFDILEAAGARARERKRHILKEELVGRALSNAILVRRLRSGGRRHSSNISLPPAWGYNDGGSGLAVRETAGTNAPPSRTLSAEVAAVAGCSPSRTQSTAATAGGRRALESRPSFPHASLRTTMAASHAFAAGTGPDIGSGSVDVLLHGGPSSVHAGSTCGGTGALHIPSASLATQPAMFSANPVVDVSPDFTPAVAQRLFWGRITRASLGGSCGARYKRRGAWKDTLWGRAIMFPFGDAPETSMLRRAVKRFR